MYKITDSTGAELSTAEGRVRVRLARVFKKADQTSMVILLNEIKELVPADLEWFAKEFTAAGYPTTYAPSV